MTGNVVRTGSDAERRLQELGLELEYVDKAIRAGVEARASKNDFEPPSAPGLKDWIARVGKLRELVVSGADWYYADPYNVPLVYEPTKQIALGVLLGDRNTGRDKPKSGPRSKYPKGTMIAEATADGGDEPTLELDLTQRSRRGHLDVATLAALDVWFLVTYPAEVGDKFVVCREVSLAAPIEPDSYITSWRERLIFPPLEFGPVVMPDHPEEPDDIDVFVQARGDRT
ncbi:hypothetical protein GCM10011581_02480 [Saccharopolyspora subtropica]|uniref:Uncharacterized protein n=1 Tax=Saccharopolyspora thermophila TaxID=89367 RepID=A0A917JJJ4_9PSEU|nr:hypothetical protein [Saccharopolyspora subtropica]GGI68960.1 hypothetical protein GCM10011581_02480 [Saccharopolyspora subtropica]